MGNCWFERMHVTGDAVFGGATFERSAWFLPLIRGWFAELATG